MVQSAATSVTAYLKEVTPEQRIVLSKLRKLVKTICHGAAESMLYGMPTYTIAERCIAFNAQKNYYALYVGVATMAKFKTELKGFSCGKSCWRITHWEKVDASLLARVLQDAYERCLTNAIGTTAVTPSKVSPKKGKKKDG